MTLEELTAHFEQYRPTLYRALDRRHCRCIDDILQDAFIHAMRGLPTIQDDAKIKSWLYRTTINTWIDYIRRETTHTEPESLNLANRSHEEALLIYYNLDAKIDCELVLRFFPRPMRKILWMYANSMTCREIAEEIHGNRNTVKVQLHRAMKRFRQQYLKGTNGKQTNPADACSILSDTCRTLPTGSNNHTQSTRRSD